MYALLWRKEITVKTKEKQRKKHELQIYKLDGDEYPSIGENLRDEIILFIRFS